MSYVFSKNIEVPFFLHKLIVLPICIYICIYTYITFISDNKHQNCRIENYHCQRRYFCPHFRPVCDFLSFNDDKESLSIWYFFQKK